ncbi:hypothetical protein M758_11G058800 [Ceratodon purpureus]|nr:hypothetical protein M758_11G058800 [Ceratodon purpureus]KAG0600763.1 hypothetical protein M758_11G058800 [Ceratodon purpureus]
MESTMVLLVMFCATMLASCNGEGLLRDSRYAEGGVSEAFSHGDSDTTMYSGDNYLKCNSDHHIAPRSTEEVSELIKRHTSGGNKPVKIRATRHGFHSSAGFVCAGARDSSKKEYRVEIETGSSAKQTTSITMLLHLMNRVVDVDKEQCRLTVGAGMTLQELAKAMEAAGMSTPAGTFSIYANLTVGGIIMASAHGSGFRTVGSLGDLVTKVKWVNAKGEIIVSDLETEQGGNEGRALLGGLGLLGVATEFTLQLRPNSRTIVETRTRLNDTNIVADVKRVLELETPHVIAFWRPDFGTYKLVLWTQVDDNNQNDPKTPIFYPNGSINYLFQVNEQFSIAWSELMRSWEEDRLDESATADTLNADVCALSEMIYDGAPMFQDTDGTPIEHGTIPTNHAMVSEDCSPTCFFNVHHMGVFAEDTEFAIKVSKLEDWVRDVKTIIRAELDEVEARLGARYGAGKVKRCMPPGYFWLRFGKPNQNLLSTGTGSEDVVFVQWTHLTSALIPNMLAKHSSAAETLEQLTLCKYKGRPHWGKNHERIFRHPDCKVRDNFPAENIDQVLAMQQLHDPAKIFQPDLFEHLLERSGPEYSELCTPHFWCYCGDDSHCPAGHACRSSATFPEYKVCRLVEREAHHQQDHVEL